MKLELIEKIELKSGSTAENDKEMCVMEAVAYVAGEEWSDHPQCVSPVIAAFCRNWNDSLDDKTRQRLKPYIPRLIGTRDGAATESRLAWMATDWQARVQAPAWMKLSKTLQAHGVKLAALPELTKTTWPVAKPILVAARDAARDAAGAAAGDAAWAAAGAAAGDAAGAAAWAAAGDAAGAAAWAAAGAAAWAKLKPTVVQLQESAFGLLDRMIAVAKDGTSHDG